MEREREKKKLAPNLTQILMENMLKGYSAKQIVLNRKTVYVLTDMYSRK